MGASRASVHQNYEYHEKPRMVSVMSNASTHETPTLPMSSIMPSRPTLLIAMRSATKRRTTDLKYAFLSSLSPCSRTKASIDDIRKSRISMPFTEDECPLVDVNGLSILSGRRLRFL